MNKNVCSDRHLRIQTDFFLRRKNKKKVISRAKRPSNDSSLEWSDHVHFPWITQARAGQMIWPFKVMIHFSKIVLHNCHSFIHCYAGNHVTLSRETRDPTENCFTNEGLIIALIPLFLSVSLASGWFSPSENDNESRDISSGPLCCHSRREW